jgi:hypothetical protein
MHAKKHLSFKSLILSIKDKFKLIPEGRAANASNKISDVMMSGLACMYMQSPSLLDFQRKIETRHHKNNLRSIFKVENIPTDNGMRNILDIVDSEVAFRPIFKDLFMKLQRGKHLEQYQTFPGKYLMNIDGTQYFSSADIGCNKCLIRGNKKKYNCHQVLQGAIVKAGSRQVIQVMPEEICAQDGDEKEDCEVNAFMRFVDKFRKDHDKLGIIYNGDALYATTPVISKIHEKCDYYIFRVKDEKHKSLKENVAGVTKSKLVVKSLRSNDFVIEYCNDVELFKTTKIRTNYLEAREIVLQKDGKHRVQFIGKWITDLVITDENAKTIIDSARARWKIENECFNTLKNHGYNIEHNYGHGEENLCYNFYNFTLLAFALHQIHQLTDNLFKRLRASFGRLDSLWQEIKVFMNRIYFEEMEHLWLFLLKDHLSDPPT